MKSPLPPWLPKLLKCKLAIEAMLDDVVTGVPDTGVQVIVQMRPINKEDEEGEMIVQKIANDSLSINGHTFTFDSVADMDSTQVDVFLLVGVPLFENCLAGFNSSVFAYGLEVERLVQYGAQPKPCWKKLIK